MNDQLAVALRKIAEGLYEAADVLFEAADTSHVEPRLVGAPVATQPEFPPFEPADPEYEALPIASDAPGLGRCPNHGTPWSVKPAGVSKMGKAYNSFYKCDGKNADGTWCNKRPTKAWADAHPIAA